MDEDKNQRGYYRGRGYQRRDYQDKYTQRNQNYDRMSDLDYVSKPEGYKEDHYKRDGGYRGDYRRESPDYYRRDVNPSYKRDTNEYYRREQEETYKSDGSRDYMKRTRMDQRTLEQHQRQSKARHVPADPNNTIGVFGFSPYTTDEEVRELLKKKLPGMSGYTHKLIMDERTGLCKGFCFLDFKCLEDALTAKEILSFESFRGLDFKCDFSYKHGIVGG